MSPGHHDGPGLSGAAESFRQEVCGWLTTRMDPTETNAHLKPTERTGLSEPFERALHLEAGARGWLGISVPAEVGGGGQPPTFAAAFGYEAAYHDAPLVDTAIVLAGAPVVAFGTPEQHRGLLARMLSGDVEMCIAYTEPDAGNDLAALTTTALPQRDGSFLLRGHKALITGADKADVCLTIARTDPSVPARRGSSMFLVDMTLPGVSVRPQRMMAGYDLWEVLFDQVRLPAGALLGVQDDGWRQLAFAVEQERTGMFTLGWCQRLFDEIHRFACIGSEGERPIDEPVIADGLARLWADLQAGRRCALALTEEEVSGHRTSTTASMAKVTLTELAQRLAQFGTEIAGTAGSITGSLFGSPDPAAPAGGRLSHEYLFRFEGGVGVGANELHRTGIAAALGVHAPRTAATGPQIDLLADGNPLRDQVRALTTGWGITQLEAVQGQAPGYDAAISSAVGSLLPPALRDALAVLEELAFAGCPNPLRSRHFQCTAMVPGAALAGDWAVALPSGPPPQLTGRGAGGYALSGSVGDVEFGDSPAGLIVPAELGSEPVLIAVPVDAAGVTAVTHPTLSANRLTDFTFTAVSIADERVVSRAHVAQAATRACLTGVVALCAEIVGHAAALLAATVDRVTSRQAFGSTLAALPTVQQRVADMYLDFVAARAAVVEAAEELDRRGATGDPPARLVGLVSAARLTCGDGALRIAAGAHQLCGGWGQLWETGLHHHTRAIKAAEGQLGRAQEHAAAVGILLAGRR